MSGQLPLPFSPSYLLKKLCPCHSAPVTCPAPVLILAGRQGRAPRKAVQRAEGGSGFLPRAALRAPFTLVPCTPQGPPLGLGGTLGRRSGKASRSLYIFSSAENWCGLWGSIGAEEAAGTKALRRGRLGCVPRAGARGLCTLAESRARARRQGAAAPAPQSLMGQRGLWRPPGAMVAAWPRTGGQLSCSHRLTGPGTAPAAR